MSLVDAASGAPVAVSDALVVVSAAVAGHTFDFTGTAEAVLVGVRAVVLAECPWLTVEQVRGGLQGWSHPCGLVG